MDLMQFRQELFARGASQGFSDMEVYYQSDRRFTGSVFQGEVNQYTIAVDGGLAFRGLLGGKMGYAYTEKIDASAIDLLVSGALASAAINDNDQVQELFGGSDSYATHSFYAQGLERVTPAERIDFLKRLEAECLRLDPRVTSVQYCGYSAVAGERMIANTLGVDLSERTNFDAAYAMVVVKEGEDIKSAMELVLSNDFHQMDPVALAAKVVAEAISSLGAEPVQSRQYPVLLKNKAAAALLKAFLPVFFGDNVQKGKSLLKDRVGSQVAGDQITMVDDPFLPEGADSRTFDSEGVASRRMALVEKGVLKGFLHNLRSARAAGVESTGHGYKSSYKGAVTTAPSNLYVEPGNQEFGELVESVAEGLIITSLSGLHSGANPVSGDFSLQASGYYIEGGRIRRPVNQITVAGNFYEVLTAIEAVGSDLAFTFPGGGYIGSPTLKVRSLAVSGK